MLSEFFFASATRSRAYFVNGLQQIVRELCRARVFRKRCHYQLLLCPRAYIQRVIEELLAVCISDMRHHLAHRTDQTARIRVCAAVVRHQELADTMYRLKECIAVADIG